MCQLDCVHVQAQGSVTAICSMLFLVTEHCILTLCMLGNFLCLSPNFFKLTFSTISLGKTQSVKWLGS